MNCTFNTPLHDGLDILPVRLSIRKDIQLACSGCRTHIAASTYLRVVDRRLADVPVAVERRHFRGPRWLSRLTARVDDGWRAA